MSGGGERPYPAPNYAVFEAAADVPAPPRLSPSSFLLRPKAVPAFPGEEEEAGDGEAVRTRACVREGGRRPDARSCRRMVKVRKRKIRRGRGRWNENPEEQELEKRKRNNEFKE